MKNISMSKANLILLPPLLALTLLFFILTAEYQSPEDMYFQKELYAILAFICNIGFLSYQFRRKATPKFYLKSRRTLSLKIHLLSVALELGLCVLAYLLQVPALAILAALVVLVLHVPTSLYQTPDVNGAKGVMVPTYIFITILHAFLAIRLLLDPGNFEWTLDLFLVLNIYVLGQLLYAIFMHIGLFRHTRYTTSMLFSIFMVLPLILGPIANVGFLFLIMLDIYLFQTLMGFSPRQKTDLFIERARTQVDKNFIEPALNRNGIYKIINKHPDYSINIAYNEEELAKIYFEVLDTDKSGGLNQNQWDRLANSWKVRSDIAKNFFNDIAKNDVVDFKTFYQKVWLMGAHTEGIPTYDELENATSKEKANAIFKQMDLYNENCVGQFSLTLLLAEWGLRPPEINEFIGRYPDGVSPERFHDELAVIWGFYVPK